MTNKNNVLSNLRVLYVEDEEATKYEMIKLLKRRIGKLYTAENGVEGIEAFKENNPHIVITDLKMPIMDGLEMIRNIRKMGYTSSIIITSALSDTETIIEAVEVGIVKYVVKPINPMELIHTMEKVGREIFKNKMKETVIEDNILLSKEEKLIIEKKIKSEVAHFIKVHSGKGPKDVQVFIEGDVLEIKAFNTLTNLEQHLISNNRNHSMVEYNRRLFYLEGINGLEERVKEILKNQVKVIDIIIDCRRDIDRLTFSIL
ncbi:response regulator [Alkaliphilus pronyensis]|uniref:Stage 0 sporulation protein A homolog n=1 Tax=Alkaliphilus pronyensis TaxID=1482732 RepID=A0A6I0EZR6_9FIRM|nr:Na-translocating system protein MpsC family protein [Alkaliphilus pronyensis]KAB3532794.1 response regulator [Alkaliphilus pronyensis]